MAAAADKKEDTKNDLIEKVESADNINEIKAVIIEVIKSL